MAVIPSLQLKVLFFIHLVLTAWAIQGEWLSNAYIYYNTFFLFMLLWSIHNRESEEPVFMSMVLNAMSVLMDIIVISVGSSYLLSSYMKFTMAIACIHLILRLPSCVILYRIMNERGGEYSNLSVPNLGGYFGSGGQSGNRGPYENIDQPVPQSMPQNNVEPSDTFVRFPAHKS